MVHKNECLLDSLALLLHLLLEGLHLHLKLLLFGLKLENLAVVELVPGKHLLIQLPLLVLPVRKHHIFHELVLGQVHRAVQRRQHLSSQLGLLLLQLVDLLGLLANPLDFLLGPVQ